jgi:hypothetical protein
VDSLGDMTAAICRAAPDQQATLYQALRLDLRYDHRERAVTVVAAPRVANGGVRGGMCALPLHAPSARAAARILESSCSISPGNARSTLISTHTQRPRLGEGGPFPYPHGACSTCA